jgi:hypothetical protein
MKAAAVSGLDDLKFSEVPFELLLSNMRSFPSFGSPDRATVDQQIAYVLSPRNVLCIGRLAQDRPGADLHPTTPHFRAVLRPYLSYLQSATVPDVAVFSMVADHVDSVLDAGPGSALDPCLLGQSLTRYCLEQGDPYKDSRLANVGVDIVPWIHGYFKNRSLLFVRVPFSSHCYHAIIHFFLR